MIGNRLPSVPVPAPAVRGHVGEPAGAAVTDDLGGVGVGAYVANQDDPLNQVLHAQDVRQATVDVSGGGTATVSISSSKDAVVVKMNGVPAPPAGKVYQMWLIPKDGSAPVSQGLMDAEALYVDDPRFTTNYDKSRAGLAPDLFEGIKAYAAARLT